MKEIIQFPGAVTKMSRHANWVLIRSVYNWSGDKQTSSMPHTKERSTQGINLIPNLNISLNKEPNLTGILAHELKDQTHI